MPGTTYPPGPPSIDAQGRITVEQFLKNPTRVQSVIADLTAQRFLAERIFSAGNAEGGAVVFDQVTASQLYTDRDVQAIEPGSEFPLVSSGETTPMVAAVTKWGGAAVLTDEAVRRDSRDVLQRELTKLRNTIVRKVDTVAIAALNAAPIVPLVGTDWDSPTTGDPILDLAKGRSMIDDADMGYTADVMLINPKQYVALMSLKAVRDSLPRESTAGNPIVSGQLNGYMGFEWYVSNRVAVDTAYMLSSKMAGSLRDELGLYSRVVPQPERERTLVQAARVTVPIVTDPKAVVRITGL
jgi:hypothetical protein